MLCFYGKLIIDEKINPYFISHFLWLLNHTLPYWQKPYWVDGVFLCAKQSFRMDSRNDVGFEYFTFLFS
jgi:hypothetical protein